jgi:integrase
MIKHGLTIKKVQRARPGRHADGHGLYLEVGERSASWTLRWQKDGKEHWHGLGSLYDLTLDEAREAAREARKIIKAGGNPIDQKRAVRAAQAQAKAKMKTFGECARAFFDDRYQTWSKSHAQQWSSTVLGVTLDGKPVTADHCRALRNMPVNMVDIPAVLSVIRPLWVGENSRQETAARLRNRIESVLNWATVAELRSGSNPAALKTLKELLPKRLKRSKRIINYASMPYQELPGFMAQLRTRTGLAARALEFAILTCSRTTEARLATWKNEIDFDAKLWTIPATRMKAGTEHRQPLSDAAIELLRKLPREDGHPYLFLSANPGQPLADSMLLKTLQRMGRTDLTVHGFRATFSTWASERTSFPSHVIELCLAHAIGKEVEAAYKRTDLLEHRRQLLSQWAAFCTTEPVADDEKGEKVVGIGTAAGR